MVKIFLKPALHKAKEQGSKDYTEATLFPVLSVSDLLPNIEKNHYLHKIEELVALPQEHFKEMYEVLIDNFSRYVQVLPESYGEALGGLLNDGLRRGLLAIQVLRETHQGRPHPLLIFAAYSIALLSDVGQLFNYQIAVCDQNGVFIDDWYPILGSLEEFADYYKLRPIEAPHSLVNNVTSLLARQMLSETAMTWLASNHQIFDMWLAFLNKGEDWDGSLGKLLKIDKSRFESRQGEIGIIPIDLKTIDPLATDVAEKFLAWLKKGLDDGSITHNQADSMVHVVKVNDYDLSVFLQAPELFQQFVNNSPNLREWMVVCKQFNLLGLTKVSGQDVKFEQFFSEAVDKKSASLGFLSKEKNTDRKMTADKKNLLSSKMVTLENNIKEGILVKNAKSLFGKKQATVSQYLREVEMRWGLDNALPKLRQSQVKADPTPTAPTPQNGFKKF